MKQTSKIHPVFAKGCNAGHGLRLRGARLAHCVSFAVFLCAYRPDASAQLAITEVMSSASTNGLEGRLQRPDFWELTNFGTDAVNLAGYRWFDADDIAFADRQTFPATSINPGESIIFVRESMVVPDEDRFREWWGLPSDLRIYYWLGSPGFDGDNGDAVRLWDAEGNLVDVARFGSAHRGVSFTYDTTSGVFSEFSQEGAAGAFRAADGEDIGSPGNAINGPVALRITQQPVGQTVDAGSEVILKAQATGRPAPQYRWYANGLPVQSPVTIPSTIPRLVCFVDCGPSWRRAPGLNDLTLQGVQPSQSADYSVEVFNGLESLVSTNAAVMVSTSPSPIQIECPPEESCIPCAGTALSANLVASPGQTAIFTVRNRGYPLPTFQWSQSVDGVTFTDLPGETSRDLVVSNLQDSDARLYRVRMENPLGTATAIARLTVKPLPQLEITEVMAWACSALDRDWWELTNTGGEPVNLCGYRWDDETARVGTVYTIGGGPTITNDVTVQPGESVILLESQTAESFVQWWGASNLPPNLRFVTYAANGLGEALGDTIYLWHPNETDGLKSVATVTFSGAKLGVTRWFDFGGCESGKLSTNGFCGAFKSEQGCEIGSPGWTHWSTPKLTSIRREGTSVVVTWSAQPGSTNRVQFAHRLAIPLSATEWNDLGDFQSAWATCTATDLNIEGDRQRFYRVQRVAAAKCGCP